MASIFNSLNIGYSGLSAAQVGINTTGQNIVNAETEGYTRQRVVYTAATPIFSSPGNTGNGVEVQTIKRVFDNFVFDRYNSISADKEYSDYSQRTLEELSTYFPDIDGVGIKSDLEEYYNLWQSVADNADNDAVKVALAQQTENLTQHITQTQTQITTLQSQLNDDLVTNINQVNELALQLAEINRSIDVAEAGSSYDANDLRDKRNVLERDLSRLIGAEVNQGNLSANIEIDSNSNTRTGSYTLSVNGFNIVDGSSFHPIVANKANNPSGFFEISFEREDGVLIPIDENLSGGKIGAIFDLRGGSIDPATGAPVDGILQNSIEQLDVFAQGLIEATNNLYAASSTTRIDSNDTKIDISQKALVTSGLNINQGAFDLVVYDIDGNEVARRSINIDSSTVLSDPSGTNLNSIESQITINKDDNSDSSANNDIDDFINFNYQAESAGEKRLELSIKASSSANGYTFSIEDKLKNASFSSGSNFAGALGLGRYFDGDSASNIKLSSTLKANPTKISTGFSGLSGDNRVALNVIQQQFESYDFKVRSESYNTTIYGIYDIIATEVGIATNTAISRNETVTTQFNATEIEFSATSRVNIDEELTNLIKYQTSYGAAAKLITTIDQMMQTLLGIKQ